MCIYGYITLQRECDLDLQWNVDRIRALHLELPTGVPNPTAAKITRMDQKFRFYLPLLNQDLVIPLIFLDPPSPLFKIIQIDLNWFTVPTLKSYLNSGKHGKYF